MAEQMKIEYINPFLVAGTSVLSDMCGLKLTAGKPYVKTTSFDSDYIVISLGNRSDCRSGSSGIS